MPAQTKPNPMQEREESVAFALTAGGCCRYLPQLNQTQRARPMLWQPGGNGHCVGPLGAVEGPARSGGSGGSEA